MLYRDNLKKLGDIRIQVMSGGKVNNVSVMELTLGEEAN